MLFMIQHSFKLHDGVTVSREVDGFLFAATAATTLHTRLSIFVFMSVQTYSPSITPYGSD
jgi:hypothetical protein